MDTYAFDERFVERRRDEPSDAALPVEEEDEEDEEEEDAEEEEEEEEEEDDAVSLFVLVDRGPPVVRRLPVSMSNSAEMRSLRGSIQSVDT
jgi:hypothetical protein